jgi:hypothetical protein
MPPEPKRPIENILEASAKARRAEFGVDPSMPNPMRARLHDEITRLNREDQPQRRRSWLARFWPQVSFAVAAAAVVITAAVVWQGRPGESAQTLQLATRAPAPAESESKFAFRSLDAPPKIAMQPAAPSTDTVPSTDRGVIGGSLADHATASKSADADIRKETKPGEAGRFGEAAPMGAAATGTVKDEHASIDKLAQQEPASAAALALAQTQKSAAATFQQRFSQTARGQTWQNNYKMKQAVSILDTFQVEQDGREIRMIDADGSTYTGKFEQRVAQNSARSYSKDKRAAVTAGVSNAANEQFFRATGYSASLKKRVVLEGNYIVMRAESLKKFAAEKSDGAKEVSARIVGTAQIPGEPPVQIDAASVPR